MQVPKLKLVLDAISGMCDIRLAMDKKDIKERLLNRNEVLPEQIAADPEDISVVSANLPNIPRVSRAQHRPLGFWPRLLEKCRNLPVNQAVKVKLLPEEQPSNFSSTARTVAKNKGFYLNVVYKHPFMYLWPDRIRGRVLPQDRNTKGAVFFEKEEEEK